MATLISMPKLSDTMEEGAIANWLKKEGDFVEEGELLAEIETDKATMEYESPEEGVLFKIVIAAGEKGDVGSPLAVFADKGEKPDLDALLSQKGSAPAMKAEEKIETAKPDSSQEVASAAASSDQHRVKSSPLARKIAAANEIDVASINGTGPGGRVVKKDIETALSKGSAVSSVQSTPKESLRAPSAPAMGFEDTVERVSMMRQTIAKRLLSGKNDAPHFYLTREIDMTRAIEWRKRLNADANPEQGVPKVSFNDIIMLASAKALRKHPEVNASWEGDTIRKFGHVSISMAVALPTGLVTPVIRNTDMLGVRQIAIHSKDFANRARNNQLSNADYTGGTFTISNLGMADMDEFTAIINPPQSCILAVGATKMRAVVAAGSNEIVARPIMRVTLSCDHRVVDGWVGAMFLKDLVAHLEDPLMMLS